MRLLFMNRWNSFWHVFFGVLSVRYRIIIPSFHLYLLIDWHDKNVMRDLIEFFVGYGMYVMIIRFYLKSGKYRKVLS